MMAEFCDACMIEDGITPGPRSEQALWYRQAQRSGRPETFLCEGGHWVLVYPSGKIEKFDYIESLKKQLGIAPPAEA